MTFQMPSSPSRSSQAGMTEFQGVDSFGRPGPPLAIRQKRNASWSMAIVPGSVKLAGSGLKTWAKWPLPSRLSPWQYMQFLM